MQIDHLDYIKLVVADFKKKQGDSERPFLPTFTRASIRQECLNVYTERLRTGERRETNTLRGFFGSPDADGNFTSRIEFFPLDKFRPLENIMRGRIQNPLQANVELLAWLIDFKHRPYTTGMNVILDEEEMTILGKSNSEPEDIEPSTKKAEESKTKNDVKSLEYDKTEGKKSWVKQLTGFALAITLVGAYVIWKDAGQKQTGCMYWAADHYEQVPCNEERKDVLILPMNEEKMKNFKRITRPDTITAWSIGKIYYIKRNNTIEYYTSEGNHPVETTRSLRKLSHYMFDKYINKKAIAGEDLKSGEDPKFTNNQ